jgi:hypothetical protein
MKKTEKQKAINKIGLAYLNGETPAPSDIEKAKRSVKGGRPTGKSYEQVVKELDFAWVYFCAKKFYGMSRKEAFESAKKDMKSHAGSDNANELAIEMPTLYKYCNYLKTGKAPSDPKIKNYIEHARAALEQIENGFMKLPNHPDYKPRT